MKISYVVPFKNPISGGRKVEWFKQCIESILAQSEVTEAVFVNDGSTDDSIEVLRTYKDRRLRVLRGDGTGVVNALNMGLYQSEGDIIAGMSSDDYASVNSVKTMLEGMQKTGADVVGGWTMKIRPDGSLIGVIKRPMNLDGYPKCQFTHPIFKREVLKLVPGYPSGYHGAEDYAFWTRILKYYKGYTVQRVTCFVRKHPYRVSVMERDKQIESCKRIKNETT